MKKKILVVALLAVAGTVPVVITACGPQEGNVHVYDFTQCKRPGADADDAGHVWTPFQAERGMGATCMPEQYQRFLVCIRELGLGDTSYAAANSASGNLTVAVGTASVGGGGAGGSSLNYSASSLSADPVLRAKSLALRACANRFRMDMGAPDSPPDAYEDFALCMAQLDHLPQVAPAKSASSASPSSAAVNSIAINISAPSATSTSTVRPNGTAAPSASAPIACFGADGCAALPAAIEAENVATVRSQIATACIAHLQEHLKAAASAQPSAAPSSFRPLM